MECDAREPTTLERTPGRGGVELTRGQERSAVPRMDGDRLSKKAPCRAVVFRHRRAGSSGITIEFIVARAVEYPIRSGLRSSPHRTAVQLEQRSSRTSTTTSGSTCSTSAALSIVHVCRVSRQHFADDLPCVARSARCVDERATRGRPTTRSPTDGSIERWSHVPRQPFDPPRRSYSGTRLVFSRCDADVRAQPLLLICA
jgi:hypothetical protein